MEHLIFKLNEAIELLLLCNCSDEAAWFEVKVQALCSPDLSQSARLEHLTKISRSLAGMGSFSDLALTPNADSGLTCEEATDRQWQLVPEISHAIREARKAGM